VQEQEQGQVQFLMAHLADHHPPTPSRHAWQTALGRTEALDRAIWEKEKEDTIVRTGEHNQ